MAPWLVEIGGKNLNAGKILFLKDEPRLRLAVLGAILPFTVRQVPVWLPSAP